MEYSVIVRDLTNAFRSSEFLGVMVTVDNKTNRLSAYWKKGAICRAFHSLLSSRRGVFSSFFFVRCRLIAGIIISRGIIIAEVSRWWNLSLSFSPPPFLFPLSLSLSFFLHALQRMEILECARRWRWRTWHKRGNWIKIWPVMPRINSN